MLAGGLEWGDHKSFRVGVLLVRAYLSCVYVCLVYLSRTLIQDADKYDAH